MATFVCETQFDRFLEKSLFVLPLEHGNLIFGFLQVRPNLQRYRVHQRVVHIVRDHVRASSLLVFRAESGRILVGFRRWGSLA